MSDPAEAVESAMQHAFSTELDNSQSGEAVLQCAGRACLAHLRRHEAAARAGDAEGIHQMRVAVRRLRAILSAFSAFIPADARRQASDQLHWFADALGEARNLDVFAAEILGPACSALPLSSEFERLARAIERRRALAHAAVRSAINSDRYANSVAALGAWFGVCGWRGDAVVEPLCRPIAELGPVVLQHRFRQVRRRAKRFRRQSEKQHHQLRIALKKLRYSGELFAGLYDNAKAGPFIKQIKSLQDDLGYLNDVRVAREIIVRLADSAPNTGIGRAGRHVLAWHKHRLRKNAPTLQKHITKLLETDAFWLTAQPHGPVFC